MWRNHAFRLKDKVLFFYGFSRHIFTIFLRSANRNSAVVGKVHFLFPYLKDIQGTGKLSAFLIVQLGADSGTVGNSVREKC